MELTFAVDKARSKIGKPVSFTYSDSQKFKGTIEDRSLIEASSWQGTKTIDVVDLIQFNKPRQFQAVRFGYYNVTGKDFENLQWASRGALTETIDDLRNLFITTAKEQKWFRQMLQDVLNETK